MNRCKIMASCTVRMAIAPFAPAHLVVDDLLVLFMFAVARPGLTKDWGIRESIGAPLVFHGLVIEAGPNVGVCTAHLTDCTLGIRSQSSCHVATLHAALRLAEISRQSGELLITEL